MMGMGSKMMLRVDESSLVIGLHDDRRCNIKGSKIINKIMDMGNMMIIMISAAWCNMQWYNKRTRCSTMIGEGVTLENQLKQNVFN